MNTLTFPLPVSTVTIPPVTLRAVHQRPKKILVVDDDPVILKTMSIKLGAQGYKVITALDASSAIAAVRDGRPDLIMLDISFPPDIANGGRVAWDGFQIMSWLRGLEETKNIPFIILTGYDSAEYRQRSLKYRAVALFHKPIDHRDLLQVVKRTLDQKKSDGKTDVFLESGPCWPVETLCSGTHTAARETAQPEPQHAEVATAKTAGAPPEHKSDRARPCLLDDFTHVLNLNLKLVFRLIGSFWHWVNN